MTISRLPPFDFDVSGYPPLPRAKGLFVTGTDTDVGKTLVAGTIARCLRRQSKRVEVFKPVATDCRPMRGDLVSADAEFLAACADSVRSLSEISPVRYKAALAPNVAAGLAGEPVDLDAVFATYADLTEDCDAIIVEGIGGLLCPITDEFCVAHLAKMMDLPIVIVARAGLGTINHTLLTIHAARSAGLAIAGVVVNRYMLDSTDAAMQTNPHQIEQRGKVPVLALVPDEADNSVEDARIGEGTEFAIEQVDWMKLM